MYEGALQITQWSANLWNLKDVDHGGTGSDTG